jgi:lysophospholipid hydrolase
MAKGIPLASEGNPLVSLAVAMIKAVLYVLDQVKNLVTWCTITFPR